MQEKATHKTLLQYTQVCCDTVLYISKNSTKHYVGQCRKSVSPAAETYQKLCYIYES